MSETTQPEAGWYPDPADPARLRWWDGAAWTEDVTDAQAPTEVAAEVSNHAPLAPTRSNREAILAGVTAGAFVVVAIVGLSALLSSM